MYSSSLLGSIETLDRSRYAERGLIPGAVEGVLVLLGEPAACGSGARGGGCCNTAFGGGNDADGIFVAFCRSSEILS